jgi:hypothetical protein
MTRILVIATTPINVVSATPLLAKLRDGGAHIDVRTFSEPPADYARLPVASVRRIAPATLVDRVVAQVRMRLLGGAKVAGAQRWLVRAKNDSTFAELANRADTIVALDDGAVLLAWETVQKRPHVAACFGLAAALADLEGRAALTRPARA